MLEEGYHVDELEEKTSDYSLKKYINYLQQTRFQIFFLVFAVIIAYVNSLNVPFYLDDFHSIVENPIIHDISTLFDNRDFQIMRSTGTYSLAANYAIHQTAVFGYHFVNLFIHWINLFIKNEQYKKLNASEGRPGLPGAPLPFREA